jgi:uncharacterized protein
VSYVIREIGNALGMSFLMGWQFMLAEFIGGPIMIALLVLLLRRAMTPALLAEARAQAERGVAGRMEGHAAMDMSLPGAVFFHAQSRSAVSLPSAISI